MLVEVLLK